MDGQKNLTVGSWIHQFSPRLTNSFVLTWSSTQGCEEGREAGNKKRFIGISVQQWFSGLSNKKVDNSFVSFEQPILLHQL